jgi:hypothetical protein
MRKLSLCALSFLISLFAFTQESSIKNRVNLKLGHSTTPKFLDYRITDIRPRNLRLEANYGWNSFIEAGTYIGYNYFRNVSFGSNTITVKTHAVFVGVNANFHPLPLLIKEHKLRFDIYLSGKLGLISMLASDNFVYTGTKPSYAIFGGASYYLTKRWGFYAEYGLSKVILLPEMEKALWYGVTIKF